MTKCCEVFHKLELFMTLMAAVSVRPPIDHNERRGKVTASAQGSLTHKSAVKLPNE